MVQGPWGLAAPAAWCDQCVAKRRQALVHATQGLCRPNKTGQEITVRITTWSSRPFFRSWLPTMDASKPHQHHRLGSAGAKESCKPGKPTTKGSSTMDMWLGCGGRKGQAFRKAFLPLTAYIHHPHPRATRKQKDGIMRKRRSSQCMSDKRDMSHVNETHMNAAIGHGGCVTPPTPRRT